MADSPEVPIDSAVSASSPTSPRGESANAFDNLPSPKTPLPGTNSVTPPVVARSSALRIGILWIALFLVFFLLPVALLYQGFRGYTFSTYAEEDERLTSYFVRELNIQRSRLTSEGYLLALFRDHIPEFRKNLGHTDKLSRLVNVLIQDLDTPSTVIVWNGKGETIFLRDSVSKASGEASASALSSLPTIIQEGHAFLTANLTLPSNDEGASFLRRHSSQLNALAQFVGPRFPWLTMCGAPGQLTRGNGTNSPPLIFWSFLSRDFSGSGGIAIVIPANCISETYGLKKALDEDPTANPEFTTGYVDLEQPEHLNLAFPRLNDIARSLMNDYRRNLVSPVCRDDWKMVVTPLTMSSSIRVFSLFSSAHLRRDQDNLLQNGVIVVGMVLILGLFFFLKTWYQLHNEGLSLRVKLTALFLLSISLPISLLLVVGLQFSLDRAFVLAETAKSHLREEIQKLDEGAAEYYRNKLVFLSALKRKTEFLNEDIETLKSTCREMYRSGPIRHVYVVDASGTIRFDQDYLFEEADRKEFISELGRRALQFAGSDVVDDSQDQHGRDSIGRDLLNQLAREHGKLQQILWPGSSGRVYLFLDLITPVATTGRMLPVRALILTMDKDTLDEEYLRMAVKSPRRRESDLRFFALQRSDHTQTIPELNPVIRSHLIPLISTTQPHDTLDSERIQLDEGEILTTLVPGKIMTGFYLGARMNWDEIMFSVRLIEWLVFASLLLSISGSGFLIFLLTRAFLQPITSISEATRALAGGNLNRVLPVYDRDELGELCVAFNDMTIRLRNRLQELTVLYQLAQKASTSHNSGEILELVGQQLQEHLNAASYGTVWINEGEGIENIYLGEIQDSAMSAQIRTSMITAFGKRTMDLRPLESPDRHLLAVPFCYEEKDFGGIYLLFDATSPRFSLEEGSFIEMLRRQVSLIIENQRLFEQAVTDGLTHLFVRRFFLASLEKELSRSRRYGMDLSLILLDIDHFKLINDNYGHQTGDMILRETAQRILESIRTTDTPGRYGGEELAVFLPQTRHDDAFVVAERIRSTIASTKYPHNGQDLCVTVSIGLTSLCGRALSIEEFIDEVDQSMYKAKASGRNRIEVGKSEYDCTPDTKK
ncbi:MAG: diguanylate cyclase [Candidatus Riflebacteria bacterium]|nr:diguanylate cyclase [Candidatus Riflebacteria bacterium]